MFEKVYLVPYEDSANYPALSKYCEENGYSCIFTGDDEAEISGKKYEIYRDYEPGSRGNYGIIKKRKNDFQLNKGCFNKQTVLALAFYSAEPFSVFIACPEGLLR